ncbi:hypothetical protein [Nocardia sp. NPDC058705]|uniref:hypothetical protein n=1 Tax=Nocardia sp. NPDC058705 TaxID=3346609 RepID=UPI003690B705
MMLKITLPQLQQWQLGQLHAWVTDLEDAVHGYAWQLHRTAAKFVDLDDFWIGKSASAASSLMRSENAAGARLASEIGSFVTAVRSGTDLITRERERLLDAVAETEAAGCLGLGGYPITFFVDSHWRVQADHATIHKPTAHILEQIRIEIGSRQVQLSRAYAAFAKAVDELSSILGGTADQISSPAQGLRGQHIRDQPDLINRNLDVGGSGSE